MAINYTDLFTRLGKMFAAIEDLLTATGTTLPAAVTAVTDEFAALGLDYQAIISSLPAANSSWQTNGFALASALVEAARALVIQTVYDDNPQLSKQLDVSLRELIRQMIADSETVEQNVVTYQPTVTYDGGNVGNSRLLIACTRGDTSSTENVLAESITGLITGAPNNSAWALSGQLEASDRLSPDWPLGSGLSASARLLDPKNGDGLVRNANFETGNPNNDYLPNGWAIAVGTAGAAGTIRRQKYGTSTVTIAGTPASGTYQFVLARTIPATVTLRTQPIAWNAGAAEVQAALRVLPGLSQVSVTTTGTSPNVVHTIDFVGAANVTISSAINSLNTGSVTPANTVASGQVYRRGGALLIHGNGSELTRILLPLSGLKPNTAYGLAFWGKRVATASGGLRIGIASGNLTDVTYEAFLPASWTTSFAPFESVLFTGDPVPDPVYLSIGLVLAMTNGHEIVIDNLALDEMAPLYTDGPLSLGVRGGIDHINGDRLSFDTDNDRAGKFQEWFERAFDMRSLGLQLPSTTSGAETIPDSLIS